MITLPTAVTSVSNTTSGSSSVSSDSAPDIRVDGESLSGAENMPRGFLTLLGNRLFYLTKQGVTSTSPTGSLPTGADGKNALKQVVSNLPSALDNPDTLNALLASPSNISAIKESVAGDEQHATESTLSDSDVQTLQALYAMLPNNILPPVKATATREVSDTALTKADNQSTLLAISNAFNKVNGEKGEASNASALTNSDGAMLTNTAGNSDGETKASFNAAVAGSNPAFQQMMSSAAGKDTDKQESGSALNATVTHSVLTAAATVLTPTTTSAVSAPATPLLNAQLGSPEWQQALGHQILMFSRNGLQSAELRLHPQDLGSIQISLKLDNDQAQLSLVSNHSQVRDALEAAIPQLRAAMAENGINLGQSNVSSDAFQQGKSFSGQQEQQRNNPETPFSLGNENDGDATPIAVPATLQARAAGTNAVDIFA